MRNLDLDVMFQRAACLSENLVGRQVSAGGWGYGSHSLQRGDGHVIMEIGRRG